jgi:hypothetical protein
MKYNPLDPADIPPKQTDKMQAKERVAKTSGTQADMLNLPIMC